MLTTFQVRLLLLRRHRDRGAETSEYAVITAAAVAGGLIVTAIITGYAEDVATAITGGQP
jgi:hypothetical protein